MIETSIIVAIIGAIATIVAAMLARSRRRLPRDSAPSTSEGTSSTTHNTTVRLHPIGDVADSIQLRITSLPRSEVPENELFPLIEGLFRRPAFYLHAERDWIYALYAVARTRLIWEQEIIPRLRTARRDDAAAVTEQLLALEDRYAEVLGLSPEELTQLIAQHIEDKASFNHHVPRRPFRFEKLRHEAETARAEMLRELANRLQRCGVALPDLGSWGVMGRPGGE